MRKENIDLPNAILFAIQKIKDHEVKNRALLSKDGYGKPS
jgi:hypothetical protein